MTDLEWERLIELGREGVNWDEEHADRKEWETLAAKRSKMTRFEIYKKNDRMEK